MHSLESCSYSVALRISMFTSPIDPSPEAVILSEKTKQYYRNEPTKWHVRPAKTQICLGIRQVWSESSLCTQWVAKDPSFLHADSEDSDQTGRMPRLIWVFAGRTCHFVGFVMRRLTLSCYEASFILNISVVCFWESQMLDKWQWIIKEILKHSACMKSRFNGLHYMEDLTIMANLQY